MIPPIKIVQSLGANASNNPLGIKIKAKVHPFGAVLCQEHFEWWVKIWFFLAGFLPVLLFKLPMLNRWLEFRGHAIECAVAYTKYEFEKDFYLNKEASDMHFGYDGLFSDSYSVDEIKAKLEKLQPWAIKWIEKRSKTVDKYINMDPKLI